MDINELREKWNMLLSAGIENKYQHTQTSTDNLMKQILEFEEVWKQYKEDIQNTNEPRDIK